MGKGVQKLLKCYDTCQIMGLSATNVRYLDNQRDMADELFGGNIASYMTLGEAIVLCTVLAQLKTKCRWRSHITENAVSVIKS